MGSKRTAKGWNDSVTHASRTSLSFCAAGWWGGGGEDAVSLLRDNGGPGSCLWNNKGTSLLLVLFTLVLFLCVSGYLKGRMGENVRDGPVLRRVSSAGPAFRVRYSGRNTALYYGFIYLLI